MARLSSSLNTPAAWQVVVALAIGALIGSLGTLYLDPAPDAPHLPDTTAVEEPVARTPGINLVQTGFAQLPLWDEDRHDLALGAFLRSCEAMLKHQPGERMDGAAFAGTYGDWAAPCRLARHIGKDNPAAARTFFEVEFKPFSVAADTNPTGLFTGYYVPVLDGRLNRGNGFDVPLLARPDDLIKVDLGWYDDDLEGRILYGRADAGILRPYYTRADIEAGQLDGKGLELLWLANPVEAFFLHIQGSGLIRLADGSLQRMGFAAKNGHPYTSIGKYLIGTGALKPHEASAQGIKTWVAANPDIGQSVLNENASYVFFAAQDTDGAVGAQNVVLTAGRSLAVDRKFIPLGAPLWLEIADPSDPETALHRLMVAQDSGGAIKGAVRGDFFWGEGDEAGRIAGRMKQQGRYYILLPNAVADKLQD